MRGRVPLRRVPGVLAKLLVGGRHVRRGHEVPALRHGLALWRVPVRRKPRWLLEVRRHPVLRVRVARRVWLVAQWLVAQWLVRLVARLVAWLLVVVVLRAAKPVRELLALGGAPYW